MKTHIWRRCGGKQRNDRTAQLCRDCGGGCDVWFAYKLDARPYGCSALQVNIHVAPPSHHTFLQPPPSFSLGCYIRRAFLFLVGGRNGGVTFSGSWWFNSISEKFQPFQLFLRIKIKRRTKLPTNQERSSLKLNLNINLVLFTLSLPPPSHIYSI